jgi:hypothetical protein
LRYRCESVYDRPVAIKRPATTLVHWVEEDGSLAVRWFREPTTAERAAWNRWKASSSEGARRGKVGQPSPFAWSSPTEPNGTTLGKPFVGELQAWLAPPKDDQPVAVDSVRVTLADGLAPSVLQRLPWKRLLTIVDAAARARYMPILSKEDVAKQGRIIHEGFGRAWGDEPRRPGRRGHPDEFYKQVAARYLALRAEGVTDPTTTIAKEVNYNRSTVAGWVSTARQRSYLPPAKRGRPG